MKLKYQASDYVFLRGTLYPKNVDNNLDLCLSQDDQLFVPLSEA